MNKNRMLLFLFFDKRRKRTAKGKKTNFKWHAKHSNAEMKRSYDYFP